MNRRSDAEVGRAVRQALRGKRVRARRLYDQQVRDGYEESDRDFVLNNCELAVALLEALATPTRRCPALRIERLHALDGDHDDLGWYSRGHHSEKDFRAALADRKERHPCEAAEADCRFVQGWWCKVPRGDAVQFHRARPGSRGAFPVTALLLPGSDLEAP